MKLFLLFASFLLSAQSFALTNSQPAENKLFDAVTLIKLSALDNDGIPTAGYCNATIISNRQLITAAHCVSHAWILRDGNIEIQIGSYKYKQTPQGDARIGYFNTATLKDAHASFEIPASVERKLVRDKYRATIDPNEDHALITLSQNLDLTTLKITPIAIATPAEKDILQRQANAQLLVVSVNPIAEIATIDTKRQALLARTSWSSGYIESRSYSRVEPLDSGAPLFANIQGEWKIIAVVKGSAKSFFGQWDVFSLTP